MYTFLLVLYPNQVLRLIDYSLSENVYCRSGKRTADGNLILEVRVRVNILFVTWVYLTGVYLS